MIGFTALVLAMPSAVASGPWPVAREFQKIIDIDWNAPRLDIDMPIVDTTNAIIYRLICRGGTDDARLDALSDRPNGINYVGPLTCILNQGDQETDATLLAEDDWRPWHTRGYFWKAGLLGACGNYPQFGKVRSFRLRGFEMTLDLSDTQEQGGKAVRSVMKISLRNDPRILSEYSQPTGYRQPGANDDCSKIVMEPPPISTFFLNMMRYRF